MLPAFSDAADAVVAAPAVAARAVRAWINSRRDSRPRSKPVTRSDITCCTRVPPGGRQCSSGRGLRQNARSCLKRTCYVVHQDGEVAEGAGGASPVYEYDPAPCALS